MVFITLISDRIGRKRPLIYGIVAISIALVLESVVNSQNVDGTHHGLSIAGVAFLFCVTVIFSLSFGPVSWTYMAEIMPYQIRSKGCAFATGIGNWLVSTFWNQVSPLALKELGWKFYFLFVGKSIPVPYSEFSDSWESVQHCCYSAHSYLRFSRDKGVISRGD